MGAIQIIGIDKIGNEEEINTINRISNEYHKKIQRALNKETSKTLHVKTYSKGGKQKEWEINVKADAPTIGFKAEECDWELAKTLHKAFNDVLKQIEHRFKD